MNAPLRLTLFSGFSNLYEHCRHMPIYQWMNESISCFFVFVFVFYIIMPLSLQWSMIFRAPCMCVCMCVCLGSSCQCPGGGVAVWQMLRCSQRYFLPLSPPLTPPLFLLLLLLLLLLLSVLAVSRGELPPPLLLFTQLPALLCSALLWEKEERIIQLGNVSSSG